MPDQGCTHIDAMTTVKQPKHRECEECVKIRRRILVRRQGIRWTLSEKSDHFDGRRFVNPTGTTGQPFSAIPRMLAQRAAVRHAIDQAFRFVMLDLAALALAAAAAGAAIR